MRENIFLQAHIFNDLLDSGIFLRPLLEKLFQQGGIIAFRAIFRRQLISGKSRRLFRKNASWPESEIPYAIAMYEMFMPYAGRNLIRRAAARRIQRSLPNHIRRLFIIKKIKKSHRILRF